MSNSTILIVDDDPATLASMSKILRPNYQVRAANCGARALEVAKTEPRPDVILLDIVMPEMDGYSVLSQLKKNPATRDIPVIFVTSVVEEEAEGFYLGASDYITKPIKPNLLLARVKTHVTLKQAADFLNDKNDFLEAEVARRMEENQVIQNVSIRALAHLAETRDPETGYHIVRTQSYVKILAEQLQKKMAFIDVIDSNYIELLTKSAPLHDIGKVGIPDVILLKPDKLDDGEWTIMKTHSLLGVRAIEKSERDVDRPIQFLSLAKEVVHWHHERWDGNGYPDGLSGTDIPLSARIMALADVFDAIVSPRVYKSAMPYEHAYKTIVDDRNKHFDPDIVDAFIESYDQFVEVAEKYRNN